MRESVIEDYLVQRVKSMGGEVRKVKWIGRRGAPDRLVMVPDKTVLYRSSSIRERRAFSFWVELKATGKDAEPHQVREHERMRCMGQRVEVVDSFKRVDEVLSC